MNTYFLAISQATNNGNSPEYADLWRNFHPFSVLSDSDYQLMTEKNDLAVKPVQD